MPSEEWDLEYEEELRMFEEEARIEQTREQEYEYWTTNDEEEMSMNEAEREADLLAIRDSQIDSEIELSR